MAEKMGFAEAAEKIRRLEMAADLHNEALALIKEILESHVLLIERQERRVKQLEDDARG